MVACGALFFAGFLPVVSQYKGLIDIEAFGVPENYLYVAGFAATFLGLALIFLEWRCPGCGAYLGRSFSPEQCPRCGANLR